MDKRLETDRNIWLSTTRPDGKPHLIPIWFVWVRDHVYICTQSKTVKVRNLSQNPRGSFALEDGSHPLIGESLATLLSAPYPADVIAAFKTKYDWDITIDPVYDVLIELTITRWLEWQV